MSSRKLSKTWFLCALAALALAGCSNAKEQLGLTRKSPDEFAVIKRAPLAMPPDYALRPPAPGAARPQEEAVETQAREVVFGQQGQPAPASRTPTSTESAVLQQAGAQAADPSIRSVVDKEAGETTSSKKPVAERLLGWTTGKNGEPGATVVDAAAENERLKKNAQEGKPVTEGETPSKEE